MTLQLSYRAQAADSVSPAHLQIRDQLVADEADDRRRAAASEISAISQRGQIIWEQEGAKLTRHGDRILVKVHSNEHDERGRLMPILCWGRQDGADLEEFGQVAIAGLHEFAVRIGHTINQDHAALLRQAFHDEKKKRLRRRLAVALVATATVLAIGYGVTSQGSSPANEPESSPVN